MKKKIKVALIYKKSYHYFQPDHFDRTSYDFFFKALNRNERLEIFYYPCLENFDVSKIKGGCDIILLPSDFPDGSPKIIGNRDLGIPIISRTGDPYEVKRHKRIEFIEENKIDFVFSNHIDDYIYKYYPKNIRHKTIVYGLEPELYKNVKPFRNRIKNKILVTGAMGRRDVKNRMINYMFNRNRSGWYHYKLRTICRDLDYVTYSGMKGKKYINEDYPTYIMKYQANIAATTFYPTLKYWEIPAAGCLTFMEITEKNNGYFLGYKDNETAVFINEKNYQTKLEEFISDPDNPKWEEIAGAGREYTMNNLTNDHATNELVKLIDELIK